MTGSFSTSLEDPFGLRSAAGEILIPRLERVAGRVAVPASKSLTQRYLVLALLARRPLRLRRPLRSEDTHLFLEALERCGFEVREAGGEGDLDLAPRPGDPQGGEILCGNNGTMLRLLTAALTAVPGSWRLDGSPRLRQRPVGPLVRALRRLGAEIDYLGREGFAPLRLTGASLEGGRTHLDAGESSQYLSALLLAGLRARRPVAVDVVALASSPYLSLTEDAAEAFGGSIRRVDGGRADGGKAYEVRPWDPAGPEATPPAVRVEGDASAACYPAAAAALLGGPVVIEGLSRHSRQGDRAFLELLETMGATVTWREGTEVEVRGGALKAVTVDLADMPDQVPTLAALAPFARGTTRIENVRHLRIKESDRLAAMAAELTRLGAPVEELPDGLVIPGVWADGLPADLPPVAVKTYGDHRIAMSLALVGLRRGGVRVCQPEVVGKSYPGFWRDLEGLQAG